MKKRVILFFVLEVLLGTGALYASLIIYQFMWWTKQGGELNLNYSFLVIQEVCGKEKYLQLLLLLQLVVILINLYMVLYQSKRRILETGMIRITDSISIPAPAGNGQYGNARFMTLKEVEKLKELSVFYYPAKGERKKELPKKGGLVLGICAMGEIPQKRKWEKILNIKADRHTVIVGATRSGKSRRMILESIWMNVLIGINLLVTDPKGELWAYTKEFAEKNDYQIMTIDFREPEKGTHYNYLQEILDALAAGNIADAIDYTWDLVAILVGEQKGEPIWHNGECATIAASILIVAMEAPEEYRNLTNVYYFLAFMAEPDVMTGIMPFSVYLDSLPDEHPAKGVFAMAGIAHPKTRGSFFSSALGTLRHFTNPKIAEMTSKTDIKFSSTVNKKTIIYLIIPDEKRTLYSLASIFIMQMYIYLVKVANQNGGRCPIDWLFLLDEFGQLPYIPVIPQFSSVGAGRGIRLVLVLQDFQQLKKEYEKDYDTILNNCEAWIYLKCSVQDTKKSFSERLGSYTVQSNSTSVSMSKHTIAGEDNYTNSANLISRALLLEDEVGRIEYPYSLISFAGKDPIMLISPDLSYYRANKELGLGNEEHNQLIYKERHAKREARAYKGLQLWGIWKEYKEVDDYEDMGMDGADEDDRVSFLD